MGEPPPGSPVEVEMQFVDPVPVSGTPPRPRLPVQPDSASRLAPCRPLPRARPDALPACPDVTSARGCTVSPPASDPLDPTWWILHRLASPQPFPPAGLPASAAPMVGDRTWRRCRRPVRP